MKLTVINSNSSGNAYILHNDTEALIIECGVRFERIKKALAFQMRKVVGCIVTHEHMDHCKAIEDVMGYGINVYASAGTFNHLKIAGHHRAKVVTQQLPFAIGPFKLIAFKVMHDAAEPLGYLISHEETGVILFLTDTYYSKYVFSGLNNVIVEANYCQSILDKRLREGENPAFLRDRVIQSHMNIKTTRELLAANDLAQVNNIVLIHLSDSNSDARRFKKEVEQDTGKTTWIAEPGLTIDFNKQPF